jgi:hypothetical protein
MTPLTTPADEQQYVPLAAYLEQGRALEAVQDTARALQVENEALRGVIDAMVCQSLLFHGKTCDQKGWPGCDVCRTKEKARALLAGQEGSGE